MFAPTSTMTFTNWMLQSVNKSVSKTRAQALTAKGNEHAATLYGEQTTESASFTLGGTYASGNMTLPTLGSTHITDFTVKYSETAYPALDVNKSSAAVGSAAFSLPFTLPVRALGVPSTITDVYTALGSQACKELTVAVVGTHTEDLDGSGAYGTLGEFRDVVVTVTFTGVSGKPAPTMAAGWTEATNAEGDSNTAIPTGSVAFEKHFPFTSDADAANNPVVSGGSGT